MKSGHRVKMWCLNTISMPDPVHCTDLLMLKKLPTSMYSTAMHAINVTIVLKPLCLGW